MRIKWLPKRPNYTGPRACLPQLSPVEAVNVKTLIQWTGGRLLSGSAQALVTEICTDSRLLKKGDLFLALRGENFDGHSFVEEAARLGAVGAVVEYDMAVPSDFVLLQVPDALEALQQIAASYRASMDLRTVAITGSNGKTSTKDLTAAVLAQSYSVFKTEGNLNNHIGLPLTLLRATSGHGYGVVEIGMNHPGEIAPLARIAAPRVAIITNIGVAHIEYMGSREAIAQEKGMLAEALPAHGFLIQSAGDEFAVNIAKRSKAQALSAGIAAGDVQACDLREEVGGTHFLLKANGQSVEAFVPVPGKHMVQNALLAATAGMVCGVSLEECAAGLSTASLTKGRLQPKVIRGIHFLDDSYNANPDSMIAALQTLGGLPVNGRRIAVLGRMNELGEHAESGHQQVGKAAATMDLVIGVGDGGAWITEAAGQAGTAVRQVDSTEGAAALLRDYVKAGDMVLVKGSRSVRMENVIEEFARP